MKREISTGRFIQALTSVSIWIYTLCAIIFHFKYGGHPFYLLGTITFGDTSAPSDIAIYFDTVFTQSLPNYRKQLTDNIGLDNAILDTLMKGEAYEPYTGGISIEEPLLYGLATMDWYDGADELPDGDVDGVSMGVFLAKQAAIPVSYTMKDIIQNRQKILDFVKTKMQQSEMGISEGFARALIVGSGDGATRTSRTGATGASAISTLASLIDFTPTTSRSIGNISQSANSWWQNRTKTSAATDYTTLLLEANSLYNTCSLGTGGGPKLFLVDQISFEAINAALFTKYRQVNSDNNFNFTNTRLPFGNGKCLMVLDEKMYDAYSDLTPASTGGAGLTYGTGLFINPSFLKLRYIPDRDFEMLTDENGKTFAKPLKGDSRLGHIAWMGELTVNNRRKHGVLGKIARTFTNA